MNRLVMTIFGASGGPTRCKLMPTLCSLYAAERLPEEFEILGVGRTVYEDADYWTYIYNEIERFVKSGEQNKGKVDTFVGHLHYPATGPTLGGGCGQLRLRIGELSGDGRPDDLLSYLAIPPSLYGVIPLYLKSVHLNEGRARIIVEKPFGYDLESTEKLNRIYAFIFGEYQIYRIDHFLGKGIAQDLLAFRFANDIFEPLWNRNYIDYAEVTVVGNLGIKQCGGSYDTTGTLRDIVQNHLIQLVALTAMEPPAVFSVDNFCNGVVKIYESLTPLAETDLNEHTVRGQYTAGGNKRGYRGKKNITPDSRTRTYIAMKLGTSNWGWSGVPFYARTGKQMPAKVTGIVVRSRETLYQVFHCTDGNCPKANKLILRLQPSEGIVLKSGMKMPGPGFEVKQVTTDPSYNQLEGVPGGDIYARLIKDCIPGDQTLFTRNDTVEASWHFFDPILRYWDEHPETPLYDYPVRTQKPLESETMMHGHGTDRANPCKNLTNTDQYCEL